MYMPSPTRTFSHINQVWKKWKTQTQNLTSNPAGYVGMGVPHMPEVGKSHLPAHMYHRLIKYTLTYLIMERAITVV